MVWNIIDLNYFYRIKQVNISYNEYNEFLYFYYSYIAALS